MTSVYSHDGSVELSVGVEDSCLFSVDLSSGLLAQNRSLGRQDGFYRCLMGCERRAPISCRCERVGQRSHLLHRQMNLMRARLSLS